MKKQSTQVYTALAIIVLIALGIWLFKAKPVSEESTEQGNNQQNSQTQTPSPAPSPVATTDGSWAGKLKASDNKAKGNLMLVTSDHVIYINTSRDYSSLINKDVKVTYTGSLTGFSLGDITAR